ncbi:MAG: hypothetical protein ACFFDQ_06015 [Candidatus Thorarchaeota archaeon]
MMRNKRREFLRSGSTNVSAKSSQYHIKYEGGILMIETVFIITIALYRRRKEIPDLEVQA